MIKEVILIKSKVEMMRRKMNRCFYDVMFVKREVAGSTDDLMSTIQMACVQVYCSANETLARGRARIYIAVLPEHKN